MTRPLARAALLLLVSLGTSSCAMCGRCVDAIDVQVSLTEGDGPVRTSEPRLTCFEISAGNWSCTAGGLPEGDHSITFSAPGRMSQTLSFTIGPPVGGGFGCSPCPDSFSGAVTL